MLSLLLSVLVPLASSLLALGLAAFVLSRNRRAWANRWLALGLAAIGMYQGFLLASALVGPAMWRLGLFRLALATAGAIPPSWLAFSLMFGESNGGARLARWRPALLGLIGILPLGWIAFALGRVVYTVPVRLGTTEAVLVGLDVWGKVYFSAYLLGLALVLLHMESLYRNATHAIRHRIRFLVVGMFVAFAYHIVGTSYALLYSIIHPLHPFLGSLAFLLGEVMIAFALVRHRLLDVNIFISRYVVYRSFTLALIGGYLLSLGIAAEIFQRLNIALDLLTGIFLALLGGAGLSLLLLSKGFTERSQRFLHAHFFKHKHDYQIEWMEITRRLSRATLATEVAAHTVDRMVEVMGVRQAAMYTLGESPGRMTLAYRVGYDTLPSSLDVSPAVREALWNSAKDFPRPRRKNYFPGNIAPLAPQLFGETPVGCLVPIRVPEALVGLLVLGPTVSGEPFGVDDRDLLAAVTAQAGALLENARLSQEASDGRELQVLARLSAFVAHDLKNAVSTLSMLSDNAKLHMAKPEFQADAIRTLGDVTTRMQKLLAVLRSPEARPDGKPRPIPLTPAVQKWLKELIVQVPPRIRLETRLGHTPDVSIDPEQFQSVLQNLVLNAIEAIPDQGAILVEMLTEDSSAVLVVSDTGCGMSPEFICQRLFRPFQTTKKRGLGIGLYQCRQIVQQAGGTLTVESQEGKGTRMIVRLPTEAGSRQMAAGTSASPVESVESVESGVTSRGPAGS